MSDEPTTNPIGADDPLAPQRAAAEQVEDLLAQGHPRLAARALSEAFTDALPELPLRFSLVLVRVDEEQAQRLARAIREGNDTHLSLGESPRGGRAVLRGGQRLGDLSARDSELVEDFGAHAALYEPRPLEISFGENGSLSSLAVELVRPEVRTCDRCGDRVGSMYPHTCKKAANKGDARGPIDANSPGAALHGALNALVANREARRATK